MIEKIKYYLMASSRGKKYKEILSLMKLSKDSSILDVGVADKEYSPYDNYFEKKYPYPYKITALSIYPLIDFAKRYPDIKTVTYTGEKFPFEDKQFSLAISNAVIEHIGSFQKQLLFIMEMSRVSHQFYFTTPAKEFPIEIHTNYPFIHWLSDTKFDKIITLLGKGWASGNYMNLLKKRDIENLMEVANIQEYNILTHRIGPFPLHYSVWGR